MMINHLHQRPLMLARGVDVVNAPPVWLQTLDLARNVATAPNGNRYVVATFDDARTSGQFVTAVYPQQNGYLTLLRLIVSELKSDTPVQQCKSSRIDPGNSTRKIARVSARAQII